MPRRGILSDFPLRRTELRRYGDDISDVSAEQIYGKRKLRKLQQAAAAWSSQGACNGTREAGIACRRDLCIRMWHLNLINVQRRDGKWILRRILNYAPHVNRSMACSQSTLLLYPLLTNYANYTAAVLLQLRPQVALKGTVQLAVQLLQAEGHLPPRLVHTEGHEARQMLTNVGKGCFKYLQGLLLSFLSFRGISELAFVSWMDCTELIELLLLLLGAPRSHLKYGSSCSRAFFSSSCCASHSSKAPTQLFSIKTIANDNQIFR